MHDTMGWSDAGNHAAANAREALRNAKRKRGIELNCNDLESGEAPEYSGFSPLDVIGLPGKSSGMKAIVPEVPEATGSELAAASTSALKAASAQKWKSW